MLVVKLIIEIWLILCLLIYELNNVLMRLFVDIVVKKKLYDFMFFKELVKEGSMVIVILIEKLVIMELIKNMFIKEWKIIEKFFFKLEKYCLVESDVFVLVCFGIFNEKNKRVVIVNVKELIIYKVIVLNSVINMLESVV